MLLHLINQGIVYSYNHVLLKNVQYPQFLTINADTTYVYQDREGKKGKLRFSLLIVCILHLLIKELLICE